MSFDPYKTCRYCKYVEVWQIENNFAGLSIRAVCKKEKPIYRGEPQVKRVHLDAMYECFEVRK